MLKPQGSLDRARNLEHVVRSRLVGPNAFTRLLGFRYSPLPPLVSRKSVPRWLSAWPEVVRGEQLPPVAHTFLRHDLDASIATNRSRVVRVRDESLSRPAQELRPLRIDGQRLAVEWIDRLDGVERGKGNVRVVVSMIRCSFL